MSIEALLSTQVIDTTSIGRTVMTAADAAAVRTAIDAQQVLVSGTSIKTVNGTSLLGSGDVTVSASPGGSSGELQYNNAGAFGGATAVVYAGSGTHLTVTAQAATDTPLKLTAAASQTANIAEIDHSAGSGGSRWKVEASGRQTITFDGGAVSQGLYVKSTDGSTYWTLGYRQLYGLNSLVMLGSDGTTGYLNVGGGIIYVTHASGGRALVKSYNNLELSPGSLGGSGTYVEINNGTTGTYRDLILRNLRMPSPTVPASASDTGTTGQISWDADYIYICTATNTWKRVAIATW